jgi:DHA1 family tetracycline resistance protein-like MFS transporter
VLMSVALAAWAFAPSVPVLMMIQAPIALAGGLFGATANSAISRAVLPHEIGGVLGIGASLESVTRALAPSLGGVLLGRIGTWAPGVFASVILVLLFPFALTALRRPSPEAYAGRPNPMPAEQPGSG